MKTIEDKLQAAHELGRIVGAAECFADEDVHNTVCGAAHALFDGLLTEAGEDLRTDAAYWRRKYEDAIEFNKPHLGRPTSDYPPDPFDFVETGEMVEKDINVPSKKTNFDRITESPEVLADRLLNEFDICPPDMVDADCKERGTCDGCWVRWLNEEATPDD